MTQVQVEKLFKLLKSFEKQYDLMFFERKELLSIIGNFGTTVRKILWSTFLIDKFLKNRLTHYNYFCHNTKSTQLWCSIYLNSLIPIIKYFSAHKKEITLLSPTSYMTSSWICDLLQSNLDHQFSFWNLGQ